MITMSVEALEILVVTHVERNTKADLYRIKSSVQFPLGILVANQTYNSLLVSTYADYTNVDAATAVFPPNSDSEILRFAKKHRVEDSLRAHIDTIEMLRSLYLDEHLQL